MDKYDVYIWGTGRGELNLSNYLSAETVNIIAYVDIDENKQKKGYKGLSVLPPKKIGKKFDYIVLSMVQYGDAKNQLLEMGVTQDKIVAFYSDDVSNPDNQTLFNTRICHWENFLIKRQLNGYLRQIDELKAENRRLSIRVGSLEQIVQHGKRRTYSIEDEAVARVKLSVGNFVVNNDIILTEAVKDRIVNKEWNNDAEDDMVDIVQRLQRLEAAILDN